MEKILPEAFSIWTDTLTSRGYRLYEKGRSAKRKVDKNITHGMYLTLRDWPDEKVRVQPTTTFYFAAAIKLLAEQTQLVDRRYPFLAPGFYDLAPLDRPVVNPFLVGEISEDTRTMSRIMNHYVNVVDPWLWSLSDPETLLQEAWPNSSSEITSFYAATAASVILSRSDVVEELLAEADPVLRESEKVAPNPTLRKWLAYLKHWQKNKM